MTILTTNLNNITFPKSALKNETTLRGLCWNGWNCDPYENAGKGLSLPTMLKTTMRMMMGIVMNMSTPEPRWVMQYLKWTHSKYIFQDTSHKKQRSSIGLVELFMLALNSVGGSGSIQVLILISFITYDTWYSWILVLPNTNTIISTTHSICSSFSCPPQLICPSQNSSLLISS